jgi:hypothetical protein
MKPSAIKKHRETYTDYTGAPLTEYLTLGVLFDEKDIARNHGCKWNPDERNWEFPSRKLDSNMLRILNERRWIVEEKGNLVDVSRWTVRSENDSHTLYEKNGLTWKFTVCTVGTDTSLTTSDRQAIAVEVGGVSNLYTKEYAESLWNSLTHLGARRSADAALASVEDFAPLNESRGIIEDSKATQIPHTEHNRDDDKLYAMNA